MRLDAGTLILLAAGCGITCIVLFLLGTVLNAVGIVFQLVGNIIEIALYLFNLGPFPGCGCLAIALGALMIVGGALIVSNIIQGCDTASRVIFCTWIGR